MPNPSQTFAKNEEERIHPNSFYEANIIPKPKPEKRHYKGRKLQIKIPDKYRCKNPQQKRAK